MIAALGGPELRDLGSDFERGSTMGFVSSPRTRAQMCLAGSHRYGSSGEVHPGTLQRSEK